MSSEANRPELGFNESPAIVYPEDIAGDLCDAVRAGGGTFIQYADGSFGELRLELPIAFPPIEHNPAFVEAISDVKGGRLIAVTSQSASKGRVWPEVLTRLMRESPEEYLRPMLKCCRPRNHNNIPQIGFCKLFHMCTQS